MKDWHAIKNKKNISWREHILIVQLGLGTSFPLSLGRNQSRRTISNTGGGGGQFPLSLAFPFLTSSIIGRGGASGGELGA